MLVAEATDGANSNILIAALLHDAIEDLEVPREIIASAFGDQVARLVEELTDDKSLDKQARKRAQVENAPKKSKQAKVIKLADKISNLRGITASPPPDWSVKRRLDYVDWARKVVSGLRGANRMLEEEFDRAAAAAEEVIQTLKVRIPARCSQSLLRRTRLCGSFDDNSMASRSSGTPARLTLPPRNC